VLALLAQFYGRGMEVEDGSVTLFSILSILLMQLYSS
jgi:hypothetical protein